MEIRNDEKRLGLEGSSDAEMAGELGDGGKVEGSDSGSMIKHYGASCVIRSIHLPRVGTSMNPCATV
jgi:hypothetical protein